MKKSNATPSVLEQAVYDTVRYYDLLELPVTATQIWQCLVVPEDALEQRPSLPEVERVVRTSAWLKRHTCSQWGYVALRGRRHLVRERLQRHVLAQDKWKITLRVSRMLAAVPFVRALVGSGSLAMDNTRPESDLDIFVIVQARRIWLTRLLLLFVAQLSGRRRKYWQYPSPDRVCLNHYISNGRLMIHPDIQNPYTAVMYGTFVPITGQDTVQRFHEKNAHWIRQHVTIPPMPRVRHMYALRSSAFTLFWKRFFEQLFLEPMGDYVENLAKAIQLFFIRRHHTMRRQPGRVWLSQHELAFHPDTKAPALLQRFSLSK